jgi:hypothetical protein
MWHVLELPAHPDPPLRQNALQPLYQGPAVDRDVNGTATKQYDWHHILPKSVSNHGERGRPAVIGSEDAPISSEVLAVDYLHDIE